MKSSSYTDPQTIRNKGMDFVKRGKEIYNTRQTLEERERGFLIYKQGLQYIVDYLKGNLLTLSLIMKSDQILVETNAEFKAKTKENLKIWLKDCEIMGQNLQANQSNQTDNSLSKSTLQAKSKEDTSMNNAKNPSPGPVDNKSKKNGLRGTTIPSPSEFSPTGDKNEESKNLDVPSK